MTLTLMVKKNTKLRDVLRKLREYRSECLTNVPYVFRPYDTSSRRPKSTNDRNSMYNRMDDFDELFQYKKMTNVVTYDMNTEVRNLSSFELDLVVKSFNRFRLGRFAGPMQNTQIKSLTKNNTSLKDLFPEVKSNLGLEETKEESKYFAADLGMIDTSYKVFLFIK